MPRKRSESDVKTRASSQAGVNLARALSKLGIVSRTVAATWISAGRVAVNDAVVTDPARRINMALDRIAVDGTRVSAAPKRYLALNKPRGLVTTARDERGRDTVYACLPDARDRGLSPVGRLDKASEGLLLFTNDTQWAQRILDPAAHVTKVYHVQVNGQPDAVLLERLRSSMVLDDGVTVCAVDVSVLRAGAKHCWLEIRLREGRNRQIRRMLEQVGLTALRLVRVAIGPVRLGELAKGTARELTAAEVKALGQS